MTTDPKFWARLSEPTATGCREWQGCRNVHGYGQVRRQRRTWYAHRYAWTLAHGPIPAGLVILHSCDNPACCNPLHLQLGTQATNIADMTSKGRRAMGTAHGHTRHDDVEVGFARVLVEEGYSRRAVSAYFGVAHTTVGNWVRGTCRG